MIILDTRYTTILVISMVPFALLLMITSLDVVVVQFPRNYVRRVEEEGAVAEAEEEARSLSRPSFSISNVR